MVDRCPYCEGIEPLPVHILCSHCGQRIAPVQQDSAGLEMYPYPTRDPWDGTDEAEGNDDDMGTLAPVADFRVEISATEPDQVGFVHFVVRLTGNVTGLMAEERSPVPEWALIRCWRKMARDLRERVERGELPDNIEGVLRAADAQRPEEPT